MVRNGDVDAARQGATVAAEVLAAAAEELARWDRQLELLNDERDRLIQARSGGQRVDIPGERPAPPGYLTRTLGSPPEDTAVRELWDAAAGAIETYRDRWGISRTDCALGRQPHEPTQRKDRDATITTLREITARLAAAGHDRDDGRGQSLAAEHDEVGRAPFAVTIPGGQP